MPYIKPVIREPYYDCPIWIKNELNRVEFVCLSEESNEHDVELFLVHLFGYNNIDVNQSLQASFTDLIKEEEVAILGGIAFFENENQFIMPSCCCGLEELSDVYSSIKNRISPWLGHDPSPGITYHEQYVRVWSDDPESTNGKDIQHIQFTYKELSDNLENTKNNLVGFIEGPLFGWINGRDEQLASKFKQKMYGWFLKELVAGSS